MVLKPKPGLEKENNAKTEKELETYKAKLTDQDMETLIKDTQELIAYQKREDSQEALATIPMLDLKDINPKAEWYDVSPGKVSDIPVLHYEAFTNNVMYVRYYYDTRVLPMDLIPYASVLAEVMGSLNTEKYTYGELDNALNRHTGGFNTYLSTYLENRDDNKLMPKFVVQSKAMNSKFDKLIDLVGEIVYKTQFTDKDRLKAVLTRHQSRLDSRIKRDGLGYARTRMTSYFSNQGMFNELTGGAEYYWFVTDLVNNFDDQAENVIKNLTKTATLLFNANNLISAVTCDKKDLPNFKKEFKSFTRQLPRENTSYQKWTFQFDKKNEGLLTASKVQYVIQGYDYKKLGYKWNGKMRVLNQVISRDWLYNQIRVIGGAYGGFSNFASTGQVFFGSYRDPNLKETLVNYNGTPEYLKKFKATDKDMTRYIIGTVSRMDRPLTPSQKGNTAVSRYFQKITQDDIQKERTAVLSVTPQDIIKMEKMVSDILSQNAYCVYGNEEKIQDQKDLFGKLVKLSR